MHGHRDSLHHALMDLVSVLTRPQPDERILREAGVALDRALFPLMVRIRLYAPIGVVELADIIGRDHSTVSRQVAKLEELGLVARKPSPNDARVRQAVLTAEGEKVSRAIGRGRQKVFDRVQADWSARDRAELARLVRRLADDMTAHLVDNRDA